MIVLKFERLAWTFATLASEFILLYFGMTIADNSEIIEITIINSIRVKALFKPFSFSFVILCQLRVIISVYYLKASMSKLFCLQTIKIHFFGCLM